MNQFYYIPRVRTNYGKFKMRFQGSKVWNSIDDSIKSANFRQFKKMLKSQLIEEY